MIDIQFCITVYNKTENQLRRCIKSLPKGASLRVDIDGGWIPNYDIDKVINDEAKESQMVDCIINHHSENKKLGKLHNIQIEECNHTWLQFIDADDYLTNAYAIINDIETMITSQHMPEVILTPAVIISNGINAVENRNINVFQNSQQTYFIIPSIIFNTEFLQSHSELRLDITGYVFEDVMFSAWLTHYVHNALCLPTPYYCVNEIPETGESLSHPKDNSKVIESTFYIMDELYKMRSSVNSDRLYSRLVEEGLRLLKLKLSTGDYNKVINYLKPYKFFKIKL